MDTGTSNKLQSLMDVHTPNIKQTIPMGHDGLKNRSRKLARMETESESRQNIAMKMFKLQGKKILEELRKYF